MKKAFIAITLAAFWLLCAALVYSQDAPDASPAKLDALKTYRQARALEDSGKAADANARYQQAIDICNTELGQDPSTMDAYVIKAWSLFRVAKYQDVISTGNAALKIRQDARIVETMGEAWYYLNNFDASINALQKYLAAVGTGGERSSTAYFFLGEAYLRKKQYSHADIAYVTALALEPSLPRWWFRLGRLCETISEPQRALEAYNKALALNPNYAEAKAALTALSVTNNG